MMNRLMITCFTALSLGSTVVIANAAPLAGTTSAISAVSSPQAGSGLVADLPYAVAKLQGDVQQLQVEVQNLQSSTGQDSGFPQTSFSTDALPNHDGAPIPNGDYSPGW
jgi:hypothetical protein